MNTFYTCLLILLALLPCAARTQHAIQWYNPPRTVMVHLSADDMADTGADSVLALRAEPGTTITRIIAWSDSVYTAADTVSVGVPGARTELGAFPTADAAESPGQYTIRETLYHIREETDISVYLSASGGGSAGRVRIFIEYIQSYR